MTKGPSLFGSKSSPSPSPLAGTSDGAASSLTAHYHSKLSTSPFVKFGETAFGSSVLTPATSAGTKRSGFEAFASSTSAFATAAARAKSPTGFGSGGAVSTGPGSTRSSGQALNAFASYAGKGTSGFVAPAPPVKKLRHDSGEESEGTKGTKNPLGGGSDQAGGEEGSEEETFADKLRAGKDEEENVLAPSGDEEKVRMTEQEGVCYC